LEEWKGKEVAKGRVPEGAMFQGNILGREGKGGKRVKT